MPSSCRMVRSIDVIEVPGLSLYYVANEIRATYKGIVIAAPTVLPAARPRNTPQRLRRARLQCHDLVAG